MDDFVKFIGAAAVHSITASQINEGRACVYVGIQDDDGNPYPLKAFSTVEQARESSLFAKLPFTEVDW